MRLLTNEVADRLLRSSLAGLCKHVSRAGLASELKAQARDSPGLVGLGEFVAVVPTGLPEQAFDVVVGHDIRSGHSPPLLDLDYHVGEPMASPLEAGQESGPLAHEFRSVHRRRGLSREGAVVDLDLARKELLQGLELPEIREGSHGFHPAPDRGNVLLDLEGLFEVLRHRIRGGADGTGLIVEVELRDVVEPDQLTLNTLSY